nr:MAG TPA: hypothetical protein [Caudoviricetes sp.]
MFHSYTTIYFANNGYHRIICATSKIISIFSS